MSARIGFFLAVLAACSSASASGTFGTTPIASATSSACNVTFDAFAAPDPLVRGESAIKLVATDTSTGVPRADLTLSIAPFMPAMGHGSATLPTVVAQGSGVYVASDVVLAMPGEWQLRTTVGGACTDSVVVTVDVE